MRDLNIRCPYCNSYNDPRVTGLERFEFKEIRKIKCADCDKNFVYETEISFVTKKAPCLNGGEHNFIDCKANKFLTEEYQRNRLECTHCREGELKDESLLYSYVDDVWKSRDEYYKRGDHAE